MLHLILTIVGIIFVLSLGSLFMHFTKPGKRTVPTLIIVAAVTGAALIFRLNPAIAGLVLIMGVIVGFAVGAVSSADRS